MRALIAIVSLLFASSAFAETKTIRIHVFPHTEDGFVPSARIQDSVNDIRDIIGKHKDATWTFTKESADISLEVVRSGDVITGSTTTTRVHRGIFGGLEANSETTADTLPSLTVILRVRETDYTQTFTKTDQLFWKDLAKDLMREVFAWIDTNRKQIQRDID